MKPWQKISGALAAVVLVGSAVDAMSGIAGVVPRLAFAEDLERHNLEYYRDKKQRAERQLQEMQVMQEQRELQGMPQSRVLNESINEKRSEIESYESRIDALEDRLY